MNQIILSSESIAAGAKGYLLKNTPMEELVSVIKSVHEGNFISPDKALIKVAKSTSSHPKKKTKFNSRFE